MILVLKNFKYGGLEYKIDEYGNVYGKNNKKLKTRLNEDGYVVVTLGKDKLRASKRIHRLVAKLFVDNPNNKPEVNHKDFNRANNYYLNLEWCTHKENIKYSTDAGRMLNCRSCEKNGRAILNCEKVKKIREKYNSSCSISELARIYGVGWTTISHIVKYETWSNLI